MVAYSFKRRFVDPIKVGLQVIPGIVWDRGGDPPPPKRQTIRAYRKRNARPGEEIQLYCGMRTKHCFLIGNARCIGLSEIVIYAVTGDFLIQLSDGKYLGDRKLNEFARADGFADADDMHRFWRDIRGDFGKFEGLIIKWEPL